MEDHSMQALNDDLARTRHAFEIWRANRKGRTRIPLELWEQAVSLLTHHPLTRVARELRLGPAELRNRCHASSPPPVPLISPAPQFLELPADLHDENTAQPKTPAAPRQFTTAAMRSGSCAPHEHY